MAGCCCYFWTFVCQCLALEAVYFSWSWLSRDDMVHNLSICCIDNPIDSTSQGEGSLRSIAVTNELLAFLDRPRLCCFLVSRISGACSASVCTSWNWKLTSLFDHFQGSSRKVWYDALLWGLLLLCWKLCLGNDMTYMWKKRNLISLTASLSWIEVASFWPFHAAIVGLWRS